MQDALENVKKHLIEILEIWGQPHMQEWNKNPCGKVQVAELDIKLNEKRWMIVICFNQVIYVTVHIDKNQAIKQSVNKRSKQLTAKSLYSRVPEKVGSNSCKTTYRTLE